MMELEGTTDDFASLSLKDLLEARDLYHFHLMNKANVVGTAVGRYLIRKEGVARSDSRTFANSEVRDISWPCVLVLVSEWVERTRFRGGDSDTSPYEIVPKALYMPDGRKVPVCTVKVDPAGPPASAVPTWVWPSSYLGPGFPVVTELQGQDRHASIGAIVTDGHKYYGLTNRHVCGNVGEPIYATIRSRRVLIGHASAKQVTRLPFTDCYPEFPSKRTFVNLDIGLFEIADVSNWRSRVYGLGPIGPIADLNEANIRLQLIDAKVVAFGATSGRLEGRIGALFYRYKSVAGFDYVADFLISPTNNDGTQPGDSGTVWHLVSKGGENLLRPIAVEWGGQTFAESGRQPRFALATSLSNACKQLDIDLVRADDTGVHPFWGQTGHYDIATFATDDIVSQNLKTLVRANLDRISFAENSLDAETIAKAITEAKQSQGFVPLADVPDVVWKNLPNKFPGGRDNQSGPHGSTGPEHPNHFADIDEPWEAHGDQTLRALCVADGKKVTPQIWRDYYDSNDHKTLPSRGLLPFRVWQHFNTMVAALKAVPPDVATFVAAAGTLSHYVGDACQPLHGSMNADGFKDQPIKVGHHRRDTGETYETDSVVGAGVHSAYESKMVDKHSGDIVAGYAAARAEIAKHPLAPINDGRESAIATVMLMDRAAERIPPTELIKTFVDGGGKVNNKTLNALWDTWGTQTVRTMADGARVLAAIWDGAWKQGNGDKLDAAKLEGLDPDALRKIYEDPAFVPSLDLNHIDAALGLTGEGEADDGPIGVTPADRRRPKPRPR
jgi:hypothetical protein